MLSLETKVNGRTISILEVQRDKVIDNTDELCHYSVDYAYKLDEISHKYLSTEVTHRPKEGVEKLIIRAYIQVNKILNRRKR